MIKREGERTCHRHQIHPAYKKIVTKEKKSGTSVREKKRERGRYFTRFAQAVLPIGTTSRNTAKAIGALSFQKANFERFAGVLGAIPCI